MSTSSTRMTDEALIDVPEIFLLIENTRKGSNFGPFLRCASAFGIRTVIVVGYDKVSVEGSHGASKHVQLISFPTVDGAIKYLRSDCQCTNIVGLLGACVASFCTDGYNVTVNHEAGLLELLGQSTTDPSESSRRSFPVSSYPFQAGNTCIAFGRQAQGLTSTVADCCDGFVHVPHEAVSENGNEKAFGCCPPLLDAQSCLSIVLHHYTQWTCYEERGFSGHKFSVMKEQLPVDSARRQAQQVARQDQKRDNEANADVALDSGLGCLFGGD